MCVCVCVCVCVMRCFPPIAVPVAVQLEEPLFDRLSLPWELRNERALPFFSASAVETCGCPLVPPLYFLPCFHYDVVLVQLSIFLAQEDVHVLVVLSAFSLSLFIPVPYNQFFCIFFY